MDIYMVVLRLIHIFAGIFWVGAALFMAVLIIPMVRKAGPDSSVFMWRLYKHTRFITAMPIASVLTTIAGILLYIRVSDTFNVDWITSTGGLVLTIGSIAGLLATGHGGAVLGPMSASYTDALDEVVSQGGPPSEEQVSKLQALGGKIGRHAQISMILMLIAVIGMASARYL
jgi:uncharacterized membrane protein